MDTNDEIHRDVGRIEGELIEIRKLSDRVSALEQRQSWLKSGWDIDIKRQCEKFGLVVFFKTMGSYDETGKRVGKKAGGRILEGRTWDEMPDLGLSM